MTRTWSPTAHSPLSPRDGAASVWTGRQIIVWGGQTEDTASTPVDSNAGAAFDPSTDRWSRLPNSPLTPRHNTIGLWTGKEAIFIGGDSPPGATSSSTANGSDVDGATYNPATRRWTRLPPLPVRPSGTSYGITATWTGDDLIIWTTFQTTSSAGTNGVQIRNRQLGAAWTPGRRTWKQLPSPPEGVTTAGGTSTWLHGRDVITGATDCLGAMSCPAPISGVAETFDLATKTWTKSPSAPIFIHPDLVVPTRTNLVLINESTEISGPNLHFSPGNGSLFDPVTNSVTSLPAAPANVTGPSATIVWTGHSLLMWGVSGNSTTTFGLQLSEP